MITLNNQGVLEVPGADDEQEDLEALLPASFGPKRTVPELDIVEALQQTMIKILKGTPADYDRAKSWEDHLLVRTERAVVGKLLNLINQMKTGEV